MSSMFRRVACSLALPLVLAGCQSASDASRSVEATGAADLALNGPTAAVAKDRGAARAAREARRDEGPGARRGYPMGPPGPEHLLEVALRELDLTAAQRSAIEVAMPSDGAAQARPKHPGREVFSPLAAAVRAGSVDPSLVLASAEPDSAGRGERQAAAASAVSALHAALSKEQRKALVDVVSKELAEHTPKASPSGAHREAKRGGPMAHLLDDLDLTDAQRTSIDAALAANRPAAPDDAAEERHFDAMRAELGTRLDGFVGDTFDAKAFVEPPAGGTRRGGPRAHVEQMAKDLATVVPVLTAAQREALATKLEKGPPSRGRMGHDEPAPEGATR